MNEDLTGVRVIYEVIRGIIDEEFSELEFEAIKASSLLRGDLGISEDIDFMVLILAIEERFQLEDELITDWEEELQNPKYTKMVWNLVRLTYMAQKSQ